MTSIVYLDQQVKQVCPNADGVSIGKWGNKSTWQATGPLTPEEVTTAQAIFRDFDKAAFEASQGPVKTKEQWLTDLDSATTIAQLRTAVKGALSI